ncbi:MAG: hypothetical protein ACI4IJ_05905 [Acutalibacteraceae bacterium]
MFVCIDDLMCYIDSYGKAYFNFNTYDIKYAHEIAINLNINEWALLTFDVRNNYDYEFPSDVNKDEWILLPKLDVNSVKKSYIQLHKKVFKKNMPLREFHVKLYDYDMYDDWTSFLYSQLRILAESFCEENNIAYK